MSNEEITGVFCDFREKGSGYMFCRFCGKETPDDSKFCQHCGKSLEMQSCQKSEIVLRDKTFHFGGLSYNAGNIKIVNEWLRDQSIVVKEISFHTFMNHNIPLKLETVPSRIQIKYEERLTYPFIFQLGFFKKSALFSMSYEGLDNELEKWKLRNSDCRVVLTKRCGHQLNGYNTKSLYYLYIEKACPKCRTPIQNENICPNCGNTIS